jgi:hypothetical protein
MDIDVPGLQYVNPTLLNGTKRTRRVLCCRETEKRASKANELAFGYTANFQEAAREIKG